MEALRRSSLYQNLDSDTRHRIRTSFWSAATRFRSVSSARRPFPSFLCIGAMRGGTTFLSTVLGGHPGVASPLKKEVRYYCGFEGHFEKGPKWYRAHFPTGAALKRGATAPRVTGEFSPYYLYHPLAPGRIQADIPDGRFIVLLRDPIERTYSQYQKYVRMGVENKTFDEAIDAIIDLPFAEADAIATEGLELARSEWLEQRSPDAPRPEHAHCNAYLCWSTYVRYIENWLRTVPRDQILIVRSEDLFDAPHETINRICRFVGVAPIDQGDYQPPMPPRPYDAIDCAQRDRLATYFAKHNEQLYELVGEDFGWTRPS